MEDGDDKVSLLTLIALDTLIVAAPCSRFGCESAFCEQEKQGFLSFLTLTHAIFHKASGGQLPGAVTGKRE